VGFRHHSREDAADVHAHHTFYLPVSLWLRQVDRPGGLLVSHRFFAAERR
jgi:hypothetical protein